MLYYCCIEMKFISNENGTNDPIYHFTLQEVQNDGIPGALIRVEGCQTKTLLEEALNLSKTVKTSHHEFRSPPTPTTTTTTTDNQQLSNQAPMFAETYLGMLKLPHCMRISRTRYMNRYARHENDGTLTLKMNNRYQVNGNGRRLLMMQVALPLCQISAMFQRIHQLNLLNVYKTIMIYLNIIHRMNRLKQIILNCPIMMYYYNRNLSTINYRRNQNCEEDELRYRGDYDQLFIDNSKLSIKKSSNEYYVKRVRGHTVNHLQNRMIFSSNIFL
ncbi:uncharacterized protein LOC123298791 [Chrysoperla carnea]|uniref:uncharacterized protein LOC123298791 n=1 Tax=Chrysoperla carnea TaxID=189513 RepID=UPI001D086C30|nr:uncharacterized protein LOC123298791 [Chrysoperla carnea]